MLGAVSSGEGTQHHQGRSHEGESYRCGRGAPRRAHRGARVRGRRRGQEAAHRGHGVQERLRLHREPGPAHGPRRRRARRQDPVRGLQQGRSRVRRQEDRGRRPQGQDAHAELRGRARAPVGRGQLPLRGQPVRARRHRGVQGRAGGVHRREPHPGGVPGQRLERGRVPRHRPAQGGPRGADHQADVALVGRPPQPVGQPGGARPGRHRQHHAGSDRRRDRARAGLVDRPTRRTARRPAACASRPPT